MFDAAVCQELEKIVLPADIEAEIQHEVYSAGGSKPALFTPNIVFDNLASRQLEHFAAPIRKAIKKSSETITEIISHLSKKTFERFPNLKRETHQVALSLLLVKTQLVEKLVIPFGLRPYTKLYLNDNVNNLDRPPICASLCYFVIILDHMYT